MRTKLEVSSNLHDITNDKYEAEKILFQLEKCINFRTMEMPQKDKNRTTPI